MDKSQKLQEIARKRQSKVYCGYKKISDYNSEYECDFVSPYSKSANNINSEVMLILQDWCSEDYIKKGLSDEALELGHNPNLPTNINLKLLLKKHLKLNLENTYTTNLFPYIKSGNMSSYIPSKDLVKAAQEFTIPMIDIIKPKLIICLGQRTFNSISKALKIKLTKDIEQAINSPIEYNKSLIFCQAHTGRLGQNNRNRKDKNQVGKDWELMLTNSKK